LVFLISGQKSSFLGLQMNVIKRKYIINEQNEKVAVQIDIKTFEKIERVLEDYVMGEKMIQNKNEDRLSINEAKSYYKRLKKKI
jgi:hypothetical protein